MAALIVVVDDDEDFRLTCIEALMAAGHRASGAAHGLDALTMLRSAAELPGIIILDLMMPEMDGYDFYEALQRDRRLAAIPVLVMTAGGQPATDRLVGATFLSKLAPLPKLFAVAERLLATHTKKA